MRDAPAYLGMDRHRFNTDVRPLIQTISIGNQGIAFDRLDLDAWVDQYKKRSNCPTVFDRPRASDEMVTQNAKERKARTNIGKYGKSTKRYSDGDFEKAVELVSRKARALRKKQ
jgi:hypothetical protein